MRPRILVDTRLLVGQSRVEGHDIFESRITTDSGAEIGRMRYVQPEFEVRLGGPPASYVIERKVRDEVHRMLEFR